MGTKMGTDTIFLKNEINNNRKIVSVPIFRSIVTASGAKQSLTTQYSRLNTKRYNLT